MCMRGLLVGGNNATHQAVIKRKGTKVLGYQYYRIPLTFIRTKGPGWHDLAVLEPQ